MLLISKSKGIAFVEKILVNYKHKKSYSGHSQIAVVFLAPIYNPNPSLKPSFLTFLSMVNSLKNSS